MFLPPVLHVTIAKRNYGGISWDKKLSRPLVLKDGKRLETLSDVRAAFLDRFAHGRWLLDCSVNS
jgi:hypothetical protein